jgi:hypothetical protein
VELRKLLGPLLSALEKAHGAGLHHLNLKLDAIQMTPEGIPVLARFASSRQAIARHSHEAVAVTTGYSPIEQYDGDKAEGPWTDVYSLGAVAYRAMTGEVPPEAISRVGGDPYRRVATRCAGQYGAPFLAAIDAALAVDPAVRPQNTADWRELLGISEAGKSPRWQTPLLLAAATAAVLLLLGAGAWSIFRPKPHPPIEKPEKKNVADETSKKGEDRKLAEEKKRKEDEDVKKAEEERKIEERRLAEAKKKAEEERKEAEKEAQKKAAAEKEAEANAAGKEDEAAEAAKRAEAEKAAADQAAKKVEESKSPARKGPAEKGAADASRKAKEAAEAADKAAAEQAAANVAAKQAGVDRAAAERVAAEKLVTQKGVEQQLAEVALGRKAAEVKAATDPDAAEKAAGAKAAAESVAQKAGQEKAVAQKTAEEKAAAEREAANKLAEATAAQKALAAKANPEKPAEERPEKEKTPAEKAAEEKSAAQKAAAEKAAADKKAAEDKAAAEKAAQLAMQQKPKENPSLGQGTPPPSPPSGSAGQVGSQLGGIWETTEKDASGRPLKRLIIYPDTHYELTTSEGRNTGIIRAKLGIISMEPATGGEPLVTNFVYKSMKAIETTGALGKSEWLRVSADTPEREPAK